jgi:hypothetical protein
MRERKEKAWTDLEIFFRKASQVVCCVMILEAAGDECSRSVSSSPESTEEDKADRADQPENLEEGSLSCLIPTSARIPRLASPRSTMPEVRGNVHDRIRASWPIEPPSLAHVVHIPINGQV